MINFKTCTVTKIIERNEDISIIEVEITGKNFKAINYNNLSGVVSIGDQIKVNTTAVDLNLGTGGYHFVMSNDSNKSQENNCRGHIMKLRYTPFQLKCYTPEEDEKNRKVFNNFTSLLEMPVVVGTLHSMLAPIAATIKFYNPSAKVAYIMTDGGALPIAFSNTVKKLKDMGVVDCTITYGHAFGGDYDTINIYSSLITAKEIAGCDLAIVAMGPGIVGTGTKYGFSGIEQGCILDAVNTLFGTAIAVPRISFMDERNRHRGISHHSITILNDIVKTGVIVPFPNLTEDENNFIRNQLTEYNIMEKHKVIVKDGDEIIDILDSFNLDITTMGRSVLEDGEFFKTLCAAGKIALQYL